MPYLVAEVGGSIIGYAYCNWFKPRAAYRFTVESTIYLDKNMCGKGFGRQLLNALIQAAELVGVRKMIAGIGDSENNKSIGLHRAAGFSHVGTFKSCGWKFNRWLDVIFLERSIGEGDTTAPE
jgi:L-amino acid N-acyltransferase YncA